MDAPIRISVAEAALRDLERLEDFLKQQEDPLAGELLGYVLVALGVLTHQPGIGRPVEGTREFIIERGRTGYLARYDYNRAFQQVTILRIRHQRESGYNFEET